VIKENVMSDLNPRLVRRLRKHQMQRFPSAAQLCLRAEHGTLWVTIDGDPEDYVLDPGQSRVFDQTAPAIVTAIGGDAVLSAVPLAALDPPARSWQQAWPPAWLRRIVALGMAPSQA
jgi:Protein of unknown function (DUF2917)